MIGRVLCEVRARSQTVTLKLKIPERVLMEVAELKTIIADLEARVEKIRDWL
jgi:hypothetical protein